MSSRETINPAQNETQLDQRSSAVECSEREPAAVWRHIDQLSLWAKNPRKNDAAAKKLAGVIKRLGFGSACLIWRDPGTDTDVLIAGNTRAKAARSIVESWEKGEREFEGSPWHPDAVRLAQTGMIPCRQRDDMSREEAELMALADNRMGEEASWDDEKLAALMGGLPLPELELVGWSRAEVDGLLLGDPDSEKDAEPKLELSDQLREQWGTETGQLWSCGEHRILCGDSSDPECVRRVMGGERADMVFTGPPYGVSLGEKNRTLQRFQKHGGPTSDIVGDQIPISDLENLLQMAFSNIVKIVMSEECTVFVAFPLSGELGPMILRVLSESGIPNRHVLIWKKDHATFSLGRLDYDYQHEPILLTWGKRHKRPMKGEFRTTVWEVPMPKSSKEHPTMKPTALVVNALLNNSDVGDVVFDAYSGSGTTMIACEQTCRKARVIEIEPRYVAVALERYKDATGVTPELVE